MTIPGFQVFMRPLLEVASDGEPHTLASVYETLALRFELTAEDRAELLASGKQATYKNRIGWARTYLMKAGLLESAGRGLLRISPSGQHALATGPNLIDITYLKSIPQFAEWQATSRSSDVKISNTANTGDSESGLDRTPQEQIEAGYKTLRAELRSEIKSLIFESDPYFFEQLVVDVMLAMGYGGSRAGAGRAIGRSGDGGIDGIIDEDRLGLDRIYIQAKRWNDTSTVGRPEIQKFAGALQGFRARKGIFITTTTFSREATEFVNTIDSRIVLIDGDRLADLMIDHNVGVSVAQSYDIKRVDLDFFTES